MQDTKLPDHLLYSEQHVWVAVEDDIVTLGVTQLVLDNCGEPLEVSLPNTGDYLELGEEGASMENERGDFTVHTPLAGEVVEVNMELLESPSLIHYYPYSEGWLFRLQMADADELEQLLTPEGYEALCLAKEVHHETDNEEDED